MLKFGDYKYEYFLKVELHAWKDDRSEKEFIKFLCWVNVLMLTNIWNLAKCCLSDKWWDKIVEPMTFGQIFVLSLLKFYFAVNDFQRLNLLGHKNILLEHQVKTVEVFSRYVSSFWWVNQYSNVKRIGLNTPSLICECVYMYLWFLIECSSFSIVQLTKSTIK